MQRLRRITLVHAVCKCRIFTICFQRISEQIKATASFCLEACVLVWRGCCVMFVMNSGIERFVQRCCWTIDCCAFQWQLQCEVGTPVLGGWPITVSCSEEGDLAHPRRPLFVSNATAHRRSTGVLIVSEGLIDCGWNTSLLMCLCSKQCANCHGSALSGKDLTRSSWRGLKYC